METSNQPTPTTPVATENIYPTNPNAAPSDDVETQKEIVEWDKKVNNKKNGNKAIISVFAAAAPITLFIYCLITSGGSFSEGEPNGGIWWLVILYYWSVGIPLCVLSIMFAIQGLKSNLRWLAIFSLCLKVALIVLIVLIFAGVFTRK